ncbi:UNVERIFIED_CONTAM: hypothetical protein RMT77_003324 [Armadillidium vulgare]
MTSYELGMREAFDDELEYIIKRAKQYLPHSETVYSLLSIGFRRKIVDRNVVRMYVPAAEGLPFFIIIINVLLKPDRQTLTPFWDPKEISPEDAKILFKSLPNWNWKEKIFFNNASYFVLKEVEKIMLGKNGLCENKLILHPMEGYTYKLEDEQNIKVKSLGNDMFLSSIDESYAPLLFKYWKYSFDTLDGLKLYMRSLPAVAAFAKIDQSEVPDSWDLKVEKDGVVSTYRPVCWAVCRYYGEIGFTYTLPKYRNKGLCRIVTLTVAKELIKLNVSPYVNIDEINPASKKSHLNAGFRVTTRCAYHMYLPPGLEWSDF